MKRLLVFIVFMAALHRIVFATDEIPQVVEVPKKLRKQLKSFEPSAGIYLSEFDKFLVASDDTTKKDEAWLFLMGQDGVIENAPFKINGVQKMTDIESLSRSEDGSVYILSSQGLNKNGLEKVERNLFVKAELSSGGLSKVESIELRPLLIQGLMDSSDPVLKSMRNRYEEFLDVESHFTKNGNFYVGLKDPQPTPGVAVVLNLGSVANVLSGTVEPIIWRTLDLRTSGVVNRLSDLAWQGSELWASSTSDNGQGHLWRVTNQPERVRDYSTLRPEAVAPVLTGELRLLFDQGDVADGLYSDVQY